VGVTDPPEVTLEDMIREVRRECTRRRNTYHRLVAEQKMNRRQADRGIDVFDALLAYLEQRQQQENACHAPR
jgi:hypothetical protein